ncbi:hypothetical protein ACHAXT_010398 [Thalassiosira profunda]
MGDDEPATKKRKADSTPPEGYVCRLCSIPGHWIQVCPTKKTGSKKRKSDHTPVPGKDPSEEDIERARELQQIPPPKCFCGLPSRLNKVKRSKAGGDGSRAIGKYFYFCSKKRDDETQYRYARPVEMELKKQKAISKRTKGKATGGDKAKKAWEEKKPEKSAKKEVVCKFFAKTGSCKKGAKCEFSHSKKAPEKAPEAKKASKSKKAEDEKDEEAGSNSDESSSVASSSDSENSDSDVNYQKKVEGGENGSSSSDDSSSDSSSDDDSE